MDTGGNSALFTGPVLACALGHWPWLDSLQTWFSLYMGDFYQVIHYLFINNFSSKLVRISFCCLQPILSWWIHSSSSYQNLSFWGSCYSTTFPLLPMNLLFICWGLWPLAIVFFFLLSVTIQLRNFTLYEVGPSDILASWFFILLHLHCLPPLTPVVMCWTLSPAWTSQDFYCK